MLRVLREIMIMSKDDRIGGRRNVPDNQREMRRKKGDLRRIFFI